MYVKGVKGVKYCTMNKRSKAMLKMLQEVFADFYTTLYTE